MAKQCSDTDNEFYNSSDCIHSNPENCKCLSCKKYLIYKHESDEFKARVLANLPKPKKLKKVEPKVEKVLCPENSNCQSCQVEKRYQQCTNEGPYSLCFKIRHNISQNDCTCNNIIQHKDVDNYMNNATTHGKQLPIEYMQEVMNRFQSSSPDLCNEFGQLNISNDANKELPLEHVPLPLPIFAPASYDAETNPKNYDVYHMNAKAYDLSARSAFKLLQIDDKYNILKDATKVVDLCAAPGGWSKVLSTRLFFGESNISLYSDLVQYYNANADAFKKTEVKILAVDLMDMLPIPGVTKIVGDITKIETARAVVNEFKGELADVVVCDGAADVSVSMPMGDLMHGYVIFAALHITCNILKSNGTFVIKAFYCNSLLNWVKMVEELFDSVDVFKPDSSRQSSPECFLICQNYIPPKGFDPKLLTQYTGFNCNLDYSQLSGVNKEIIPILVSNNFSYKEKVKNYKTFLEVYEKHSKIFESVEEDPKWKTELNALKQREKNMTDEEFDKEYAIILQNIRERAKDHEILAKAREKIISELENRGINRNLLEVAKFSKSRYKEMERRMQWAKQDELLCHADCLGTMKEDEDWKQYLTDVIQPINRDKIIRNIECERLKAEGAEGEVLQKRIELYTEHQKNRFVDADIKSWVQLKEPKSHKKNKCSTITKT